MADRGFNIMEMVAIKRVKVNVLPFENQTEQFDYSELLATRRIATLRIHEEGAMEWMKNYHILDSACNIVQKWNHWHDFLVCAMLSTFLTPLVDAWESKLH